MTELEQLIELCGRLGAAPAQAATMAAQLQKRASQMAQDRGVTREAAMKYLLEVLVKGRHGEISPDSMPDRPAPSLRENLLALFQRTYARSPEIVARAPGRIEFIGNHTDYNGGPVLGAAIDRGLWVGLARRSDGRRCFISDHDRQPVALSSGEPLKKHSGAEAWINYPLGVLASLPEFGLRAPDGFDYAAVSDLPVGAGLSSSAAIELASALAFLDATGERPARETVVNVGKHAENNFVGVPCGILDQGVSGFGRKDHLVYIDCRGPRFVPVPLPAGAHFWIFNTHTKHALVDGLYADRHRECMEAAKALGVSLLVDVAPAALAAAEPKLPPLIFRRARHVVEEIARVEATLQALQAGDLPAVGRLLTASHRSSQRLFENSTAELDFLVDALTAVPQVYGARLTGGGFGGAVMALTQATFGQNEAAALAADYEKKFGRRLDILHALTGEGAGMVAA
ncbi:MAG TPA: galactokinase [Opitutaceae bacterium]|nr:galactokinase [Opitutaceae bacterium]